MITPVSKTIDLGDGRTIKVETGKLAKQADGRYRNHGQYRIARNCLCSC